MTTPVGSAPPRTDTKTRRTLLLILLVGLAPVIASYAFYYFAPRDAHANYGELLVTRPVRGDRRDDARRQAVSSFRPARTLGDDRGGARRM